MKRFEKDLSALYIKMTRVCVALETVEVEDGVIDTLYSAVSDLRGLVDLCREYPDELDFSEEDPFRDDDEDEMDS